jgi:hypothetical protein
MRSIFHHHSAIIPTRSHSLKRRLVPFRLFIAAICAIVLSAAHGQQSNAAQPATQSAASPSPNAQTSSSPAVAPPPPPLIHLDQQRHANVQDSMKLMDPVQGHSAPPNQPHFQMPEMVTDEHGNLKVARAHESFSNLTLEGSELTPQDPVFGSREVMPTFIRELWQLKWRPNDPLDLYIILPRNVVRPPVSLYLYGFPDDTDRFKDDRYCERVTRNGVAVVGFVSALTGQRYSNRPFKEWFVSELPESLASSVHDVQLILNQLEDREDLDMSRVGMYGQGSGGAIAILAASVDKRIQAVDVLDPWGDWPDWFAKANEFPEKERATYLTSDFQKNLEPLDPVKALQALGDRKLRIQFNNDNGEPDEAVKKLQAAAPAHAEIHRFSSGQEMYNSFSGGRIFSWMAEQLHATAPQPLNAQIPASNDATASKTPRNAASPAQKQATAP